jgi:hypothetical protein
MFQTKVVEKMKIHIFRLIKYFRKSCCLCNNVEKCGGAREATGNNILLHMRFACWIIMYTNTHIEYVRLSVFLLQEWLREGDSVLPVLFEECC